MMKFESIVEDVKVKMEAREQDECAHTDHTNYSDSYCIIVD